MADTKLTDLPINPGEQLDHYRIESVANRSNVASTYRATDLLTNSQVAIKIPHPEMEKDPIFADRFRREQEIGALLDHPGVIKVITDGHRSRAYMVTEWFEGKPLRQILNEEKRLVPERAVRIALEICQALEYLHGRGVVHSDLRPENVLVNAQDHIRLIHFDVASKAVARRLTFTKLAQLAGPSDYISPEELKGKRADARSDIYALGTILYEMLIGKRPFGGKSPFDRVANNPVPPREIDPAISPQLQEVIYRALEREPQNRYANAHDFAGDLEHLDRVGVADRPELRDFKKRRTPQSRKALFYAALTLIPILVIGLLFYFARR